VDQPGARIHFDEMTGQAFNHAFVSEGLHNALVTHFNLTNNGIRVVGPGLPGGELPDSVVDVFANASGRDQSYSNRDVPFYQIDQGGRFYIRDTWYEGSHERLLDLTGSGEFFFANGGLPCISSRQSRR